MPLITGSTKTVVEISSTQQEELRKLTLDEEDFFRRGRSARDAREKLLEEIAKSIPNTHVVDWQLDATNKFLMVTTTRK